MVWGVSEKLDDWCPNLFKFQTTNNMDSSSKYSPLKYNTLFFSFSIMLLCIAGRIPLGWPFCAVFIARLMASIPLKLVPLMIASIPSKQVPLMIARDHMPSHYFSELSNSHHHHHVLQLALISLTLSHHFSLSFITSRRSSGLHPISSHSCWMYVRAGCPAFARPYVGVHRNTSLMSSSLLLQQCPACLVRLAWIVFVMGGR